MSNINANITDYLKQIESLTATNLQILKTLNDSFYTNKNHLYAEVDNTTFVIPSFISLENKINLLQENFENLVNTPATGEAYFNFNGNSRAIELRKYNHTPEHVNLSKISNFSTETNDIFKDFLTPIPYINIDLPTIPNDITDINVKKIVIKSSALKSLFGEKLLEETSVNEKFSEVRKWLYNFVEGVDYDEYESLYKLPTHKNVGTGSYIIESVLDDTIDDNLDEFITLKIKGDLTYNLFDETINKDLQVGDELVNYDASCKLIITNINKETNTIIVKVANGEYLNFLGTDKYDTNDNKDIHNLSKLNFFAAVDFNDNKYIKIPLEEDQYIFIAAAPINSRMNIQSAWGTGLIIDTYKLINSKDNLNFKEYYTKNVQNIGDIIFEMTSVITTPITSVTKESFSKITKFKPTLDKSMLTVMRINNHLNESSVVKAIRKAYSQKLSAEAELKQVQIKLDDINSNISGLKFNGSTNLLQTYTTQKTTLINQKNQLLSTIEAAISEMTLNANSSDLPIDAAKYRIRGYYTPNFELSDVNDILSESNVVGIQVQYRYKNISSTTGNAVSLNTEYYNYIYSDWNLLSTPIRKRIASINEDGVYTYQYEPANENVNEPSYNQIDIPISKGETVDVRIKLIYDFGQPFVTVSSDWSNNISISFPEEFIQDADIKSILNEISNNAATNKLNSLLESNGINSHIEDSIINQNTVYYHKPEHISSGFSTEDNKIISLKDKLMLIENEILLLKSDILGYDTTYEVSMSLGNTMQKLIPNLDNTFVLKSYSDFSGAFTDSSAKIVDSYTVDNKIIHTNGLNITIKNTGKSPLKLYSIFPGNRSRLLNDSKSYIGKKENYCTSNGGVWYRYKEINNENNTSFNSGYQTQNQFITFRVNDPWDGTQYYTDKNSTDIINGRVNNLIYSVINGNKIPSINDREKVAMFIYPDLNHKNLLCIESDNVKDYKVLQPNEEIVIPIYCEYKVETKNSQIYKTLSFDLRTNLIGDINNYNVTIVAPNKDYNKDLIEGDSGTDNPGTDNPGTDNPGTDNPGTDNPGTDNPGTDNPGTDNPGTDNPGTDNPGTDNPGTEPEYMKDDYNPNPNYLTIVALEDGLQVKFTGNANYSINGGDYNGSLMGNNDSQTINKGDYISFKCKDGEVVNPTLESGIGTFFINKKCKLTGNCNSLLFGDDAQESEIKSLEGYSYAFKDLFKDCKTIEHVHKDFLPSKKLVTGCYFGMFRGCENLKSAPDLPATDIAAYCYSFMFDGCTNLESAPDLPATDLADKKPGVGNCYYGMFRGCTSLESAPELLSESIWSTHYYGMFEGCTNLNYVKMMAITIKDTLKDWLKDVAPGGTLVINSKKEWEDGQVQIPKDWSILEVTDSDLNPHA